MVYIGQRLIVFGRRPSFPKQLILCGAFLIVLGLSACETPHIFEKFSIDDPGKTSLSVDAKQRVILVRTRPTDKAVRTETGAETETITCAEPSPDALSAAAAAFSAQGGDGTVSAGAAASFKEAAASIGMRTATIQILRDTLYRACEAYMNNAVEKGEYATIVRNFDRVMISLMAIDAVSGMARPTPVSISSGDPSATAPPSESPKAATNSATAPTTPVATTTATTTTATTTTATGTTPATAKVTSTPSAVTAPATADAGTKSPTSTPAASPYMDHGDQVIKSVLDYTLNNDKWLIAVCLSVVYDKSYKYGGDFCQRILAQYKVDEKDAVFPVGRSFVNDTTAAPVDKPKDPTVTPPPKVAPVSPVIDPDFLKAIQTKLNKDGASPSLKVDGAWGPDTKAAIEAFQKKNSITPATGELSQETLTKLSP